MEIKRKVVLLKKSKPFDPDGISEIVVVRRLTVLGLVRVKVEHVTDATETLGLTVTLEGVFEITSRQISIANDR